MSIEVASQNRAAAVRVADEQRTAMTRFHDSYQNPVLIATDIGYAGAIVRGFLGAEHSLTSSEKSRKAVVQSFSCSRSSWAQSPRAVLEALNPPGKGIRR